MSERSLWISLAGGRLAAKTPVFGGWKSLDFLGFSRPKSSLFNGLRGIFAEKNFSRPFGPQGRLGGISAGGPGVRKGRIAHGTSLADFLIFCKQLSSWPFPSGGRGLKKAQQGGRRRKARPLSPHPGRGWASGNSSTPRRSRARRPRGADRGRARSRVGEEDALAAICRAGSRDEEGPEPRTGRSALRAALRIVTGWYDHFRTILHCLAVTRLSQHPVAMHS